MGYEFNFKKDADPRFFVVQRKEIELPWEIPEQERVIPSPEITLSFPIQMTYMDEDYFEKLFMERLSDPSINSVMLHFPKKIWKFPDDPFVVYEPSDEQWCRALGIGQEMEAADTVEIPRALISVKKDGTIKLQALSESISSNIQI